MKPIRSVLPVLVVALCVTADVGIAAIGSAVDGAAKPPANAIVTGRVVDAWGHPFDHAVVTLDGVDVAITNARGEYWFATNRTGSILLDARHVHALPGLSSGTRVVLRPALQYATQVRLWRSAWIGGALSTSLDRAALIGVDVRYESMSPDGLVVRAAPRECLLGPSFEIHGIDPGSWVAVRAFDVDGKPLGSEVVSEAGWLDLDLGVTAGEYPPYGASRRVGSGRENGKAAASVSEARNVLAAQRDAAVRARERRAHRVFGACVDVYGVARGVPDGTVDLPLIVLDHLEKPGVRLQTRTAPDGSFVLFDVPIGRIKIRARSLTTASLPLEHELKPGAEHVPDLDLRKVVRWRLRGVHRSDRAWVVGADGALVGLPIAKDLAGHTVLTELPLGRQRVVVHDGFARCSRPRSFDLDVTEERAFETDLDVGVAR